MKVNQESSCSKQSVLQLVNFVTKDIDDIVMIGMLIKDWTRAQSTQISSITTEDEEGTNSFE